MCKLSTSGKILKTFQSCENITYLEKKMKKKLKSYKHLQNLIQDIIVLTGDTTSTLYCQKSILTS